MKTLAKGTQKNKAVRAATQTALSKTLNLNDTRVCNQRAIILEALKESPKTTVELRHDYGIMQPAPRIFELRQRGHNIISLRVDCFTHDGIKHNSVAKYILVCKAIEGLSHDDR